MCVMGSRELATELSFLGSFGRPLKKIRQYPDKKTRASSVTKVLKIAQDRNYKRKPDK